MSREWWSATLAEILDFGRPRVTERTGHRGDEEVTYFTDGTAVTIKATHHSGAPDTWGNCGSGSSEVECAIYASTEERAEP